MKMEDPLQKFSHNPKNPLKKNLKMTLHLCTKISANSDSFKSPDTNIETDISADTNIETDISADTNTENNNFHSL